MGLTYLLNNAMEHEKGHKEERETKEHEEKEQKKGKRVRVKLLDLIHNRSHLRFDVTMIPYGSNYMFDSKTRMIEQVFEDPHSSETRLCDHLFLRNADDDCYLWFSNEQYESISVV